MSVKKIKPDNPGSCRPIPHHPFFEHSKKQASFIECIDAIDRVGAMVELCDFLNMESDTEAGLSPKAAFGYFWVLVMMRETISYVSDRLMALNRQQREKHQRKAAYLSALLMSLPTLGGVNRDRFLNSVAVNMNISRTELDQFIRKTMKT